MSAPRPRSPLTTVAMRSDSLTRSSAAPRTTVSPSAKQPISATRGSSSMASGTSSASTVVASMGPWPTSRSQTGSAGGKGTGLLDLPDDDRSHPLQDAQEAGARPVDPDPLQDQARTGHEHAGGDEKGGAGEVAGDANGLELELVGVADARGVAAAVDRAALHVGAGGGQHPLGVVSAGDGLHDGGAAGGQAGEEHARLHLRRGHRQLVGDALQARAVDGEGREAAFGRFDLRAHLGQRSGDPVDGAAADRRVAVEGERRPLLEGQPAGQQAHQRPGVADVDRLARRLGVAHPAAADDDLAVVALHQRTDRADGVERRPRVGGVEVVDDPHRLGGHRADDRRAVGDRLVCGRRHTPAETDAVPAAPEAHVHGRATGKPRSAMSA